jgi:hypothetical protein
MISNHFLKLQQQEEGGIEQAVMITMKTDLNQNICQWKHMAKSVTDYAKATSISENLQLPDKMYELSIDEITELAIYDAPTRLARKELIAKKVRRVHIGTSITIRILLKNTLSVLIDIKNIKAECKSEGGSSGYF